MDVNNFPLVSIVIPCYNAESTIRDTLVSAITQTYNNIEIIVVNDGSVDQSMDVVDEFMKSDGRVSVYSQANGGMSSARNLGLKHATGKYIVFLDADDKLKPNYIQQGVQQYQQNANLTILYSNMELFERDNGIQYLPLFSYNLFLRANCIPSFAMVQTRQMKTIGGFDEAVGLWEDWECWMHLLKVFQGDVYRIEEPQYLYRKRLAGDSITDQNKDNERRFEEVSTYVFAKHYALYKRHKMSLQDLYNSRDELLLFKRKYYGRWYRKLLYKILKPKKFLLIYEEL